MEILDVTTSYDYILELWNKTKLRVQMSGKGWGGSGGIVFNATFNNISAISWRSVLQVEEIGGPGEDQGVK